MSFVVSLQEFSLAGDPGDPWSWLDLMVGELNQLEEVSGTFMHIKNAEVFASPVTFERWRIARSNRECAPYADKAAYEEALEEFHRARVALLREVESMCFFRYDLRDVNVEVGGDRVGVSAWDGPDEVDFSTHFPPRHLLVSAVLQQIYTLLRFQHVRERVATEFLEEASALPAFLQETVVGMLRSGMSPQDALQAAVLV